MNLEKLEDLLVTQKRELKDLENLNQIDSRNPEERKEIIGKIIITERLISIEKTLL